MFKNVGTLLKGFALFLFIVGIGFSFIYGIKTIQAKPDQTTITALDTYSAYFPSSTNLTSALIKQYRDLGCIILVGGCLTTIVLSLLLYGFGQLIDDNTQMRQIMEQQLNMQNYIEQEIEYTEPQSNYRHKPQEPIQKNQYNTREQNVPYPTWMDDDRQSEDDYNAGWRIKNNDNNDTKNSTDEA